jgi:hypothetical protein
MAEVVTSSVVVVVHGAGSDDGQSGFAENLEVDVVAHLGPLIVLFGEHGTGQAGRCLSLP